MQKEDIFLDKKQISEILPQTDPFMFVDKATISENQIVGTYKITGDEFFLKGHFKDNPVFPATIMLEAIGQLAGLYLLRTFDRDFAPLKIDQNKMLFTSADGIRVQNICRPADELEMIVKVKKIKHPISYYEAKILVNGQKVAFLESMSLAFDILRD